MIFGFEFYDCVRAVSLSLIVFGVSGSHFAALVLGFTFVIGRSFYSKFYPKNSFYFWKNKSLCIKTKKIFTPEGMK
jgi:hypothetical protein